jgi:hypothetical protein
VPVTVPQSPVHVAKEFIDRSGVMEYVNPDEGRSKRSRRVVHLILLVDLAGIALVIMVMMSTR